MRNEPVHDTAQDLDEAGARDLPQDLVAGARLLGEIDACPEVPDSVALAFVDVVEDGWRMPEPTNFHHETCQQDPGQGGIAIGKGEAHDDRDREREENRPDGDRRPGLRTDWTERSGPEEEDQGDEGNADDGVERVHPPWRAAAMKIGRGVSHSVLLGGEAHGVGRVRSRGSTRLYWGDPPPPSAPRSGMMLH